MKDKRSLSAILLFISGFIFVVVYFILKSSSPNLNWAAFGITTVLTLFSIYLNLTEDWSKYPNSPVSKLLFFAVQINILSLSSLLLNRALNNITDSLANTLKYIRIIVIACGILIVIIDMIFSAKGEKIIREENEAGE